METTNHDKELCRINKLAGLANAKEVLESEDLTSFVDARAHGVCFHGGHLNFAASRQSETPKNSDRSRPANNLISRPRPI